MFYSRKTYLKPELQEDNYQSFDQEVCIKFMLYRFLHQVSRYSFSLCSGVTPGRIVTHAHTDTHPQDTLVISDFAFGISHLAHRARWLVDDHTLKWL